MWLDKGTKTFLKNNNKIRGITLHDLKTYYIVTVIQLVCFWQKDRHIDKGNRKSPEIYPHK